MKVTISAQHVAPSDQLEQFINEKLAKLEQFDENIRDAEVVLTLERSNAPNYESKIVKVKLFGRNSDYFAEKKAKTFEEATLEVADALRKQIIKQKDKRKA